MRQLITDQTYRPPGSTLDRIFSSQAASVIRAGTVHCNISPHNFTSRLPQRRTPSAAAVTARNRTRLDSAELNIRLAGVNWTPVINSEDPADRWDHVVTCSTRVLDELALLHRVKICNPTAAGQ